jgi:hypothetical protein
MKDWIELLTPPFLRVFIGCLIVIFANWINLGTLVLGVLQ